MVANPGVLAAAKIGDANPPALATTDPAQCADFCVSHGAAHCNILITSAGTFTATGTAYVCLAWPANTYTLAPYFASITVSYGGSCE